MFTRYLKDPQTLAQYRRGPAALMLDEFIHWLEQRGYQYCCVRRYIRGANRFSLWAEQTGLTLEQLDAKALVAFGSYLEEHQRLKYHCSHTDLYRCPSFCRLSAGNWACKASY